MLKIFQFTSQIKAIRILNKIAINYRQIKALLKSILSWRRFIVMSSLLAISRRKKTITFESENLTEISRNF